MRGAAPGVRVTAVDASRNMLDLAREHLARFGERVAFVCADLQQWSDHACADVVFSTATFHWVKDHPKLFGNIFRALRPGGWFLAQCGGAGNIARQHVRADALLRSEAFSSSFAGWTEPWEFASAEETRGRLVAAGFSAVETSIELSPVVLPSAARFREYVATVILRPHLAHLSEQALRDLFLDRITELSAADAPPFLLDYVRLNMVGQRRA
jgi:trans-aconitate 2-methyltransferase